jgi:hypothetical protein
LAQSRLKASDQKPCMWPYDSEMDDMPTRGWWLTRIELALGIGLVLFATVVFVSLPTAMFGADATQQRVVVLVGLLGMVAALAWMIRIFRGPRDKPPRWRYRDR